MDFLVGGSKKPSDTGQSAPRTPSIRRRAFEGVNEGVNRSGILLEMRPNVMIQTSHKTKTAIKAVLILWAWKESNLRPLSYQDSVLPLNYMPASALFALVRDGGIGPPAFTMSM